MTRPSFRELTLAYMAIGFAMGLGSGYLASIVGRTTGILILSLGCAAMACVSIYLIWQRGKDHDSY